METGTNPPRVDHSFASLIRELRDETTTLLRQEVALAKTELTEKASFLGRNSIYLAAGALVAYAGFFFILHSIVGLLQAGLMKVGLSEFVASWLAPGIVGLVVAGIGYALIQKARSTLARESLAPEKTIQSLKEDKQWTQEKFSRAA
jgi:hypothetical protein